MAETDKDDLISIIEEDDDDTEIPLTLPLLPVRDVVIFTDMPYIIEIITFIYGLCIGSFLNVCIHRLPLSKSIVKPGSMCPNCETFIRFYDNIPVFSYIWLKGRCRKCNTPISFRYVMVEILTGICALCVLLKFGLSLEGFVYFVFIAALIAVIYIDIDHRIIPNVITLPGIPIFFVASLAVQAVTLKESILGIIIGGGSLYLVALTYRLLTGKEGMGGGDIKLLAMFGALIGWKGVLFTIFVSSAIGTIAGLTVMLVTKKNMKLAIPFGPFCQ